MEYLVTGEEMKRFDKYTSEYLHVPELVLMERAALGMRDIILSDYSLSKKEDIKGLVVAGSGNNGADGVALARLLYQQKIECDVVVIGDINHLSQSMTKQLEILNAYKREYVILDEDRAYDWINNHIEDKNFVVDGIFGIGLNRSLSEMVKKIIKTMNDSTAKIYSIDIPSGVLAEGKVYEGAIRANTTITFGFTKLGQILFPGADYCGDVKLVDMGIDQYSICGEMPVYRRPTLFDDFEWPKRIPGANKGSYKKLLIIAGSEDIFGAVYLAVNASQSMGIGMISVITHIANKHSLEQAVPEAMMHYYDSSIKEDFLETIFEKCEDWCDGILIGPGIGFSMQAKKLVQLTINNSNKPLLMDADAIRIFAEDESLQDRIKDNRNRKVILTPHLGEFAYLIDKKISDVTQQLAVLPKVASDMFNVTITCKDARSVIASPEKKEVYVITSGNEGMATAGSGDVLSGISAVLMLQMSDVHKAAAAAAYFHGAAGSLAADDIGTRGMAASDITNKINSVWNTIDNM